MTLKLVVESCPVLSSTISVEMTSSLSMSPSPLPWVSVFHLCLRRLMSGLVGVWTCCDLVVVLVYVVVLYALVVLFSLH